MKNSFLEKLSLFLTGAVIYGMCEVVWRGFTHWTMLVLGGICFLFLYRIEQKYFSIPLYLRCLCGGVLITALELFAGSIVNILLGMNVWDYSNRPFNFMGQICFQFFLLWVLLCLPAFKLCSFFGKQFEKKRNSSFDIQ